MKTKMFLQLEKEMASTGNVTIDTSSSSSKIMSYYLRAVRGRNDLATALDAVTPDNDFLRTIEKARLALKSNNLGLAEALLLRAVPSTDEELGELLLEKARLGLFKHDYADGERYATEAIELNAVAESSLMTLFQVRGLIRTNLEKYSDAILDFKIAIGFSETMAFAHSGFSAHTALVRVYACNGEEKNSRDGLAVINRLLAAFTDDEMWLARLYEYLRASFYHNKYFGAQELAHGYLVSAKTVARWLGLSYAESMCDSDLAAYGNVVESTFVRSFEDWHYLPEQDLILIQAPKKIVRLERTPLLGRMVSLLADKPYRLSDLFEVIWGLNYRKELHHKHIHSILSKLRKKLPLNALSVEDGLVGLK